jgi:hypothetical protein
MCETTAAPNAFCNSIDSSGRCPSREISCGRTIGKGLREHRQLACAGINFLALQPTPYQHFGDLRRFRTDDRLRSPRPVFSSGFIRSLASACWHPAARFIASLRSSILPARIRREEPFKLVLVDGLRPRKAAIEDAVCTFEHLAPGQSVAIDDVFSSRRWEGARPATHEEAVSRTREGGGRRRPWSGSGQADRTGSGTMPVWYRLEEFEALPTRIARSWS